MNISIFKINYISNSNLKVKLIFMAKQKKCNSCSPRPGLPSVEISLKPATGLCFTVLSKLWIDLWGFHFLLDFFFLNYFAKFFSVAFVSHLSSDSNLHFVTEKK